MVALGMHFISLSVIDLLICPIVISIVILLAKKKLKKGFFFFFFKNKLAFFNMIDHTHRFIVSTFVFDCFSVASIIRFCLFDV